MCTKFQISIVFHLAERAQTTDTQIYEQIKENTLRLGHVDFDKTKTKCKHSDKNARNSDMKGGGVLKHG